MFHLAMRAAIIPQIRIGHWPSETSTYKLSGGDFIINGVGHKDINAAKVVESMDCDRVILSIASLTISGTSSGLSAAARKRVSL